MAEAEKQKKTNTFQDFFTAKGALTFQDGIKFGAGFFAANLIGAMILLVVLTIIALFM